MMELDSRSECGDGVLTIAETVGRTWWSLVELCENSRWLTLDITNKITTTTTEASQFSQLKPMVYQRCGTSIQNYSNNSQCYQQALQHGFVRCFCRLIIPQLITNHLRQYYVRRKLCCLLSCNDPQDI